MKAYALRTDVCNKPYRPSIHLFGVFDSMELAKKKAKKLSLPTYLITEMRLINQ